ncbi:ATP-binding cassette transporter [Chloropicon primus]|uniref:ATP-binding cassette transporter n=1 Tax=Chloropicon primus TaxID=1764295 RepID=A0A5B8MLK1_9CHLO|nr:ATP-binding cassette transporter [Chloropicon primus]UPR00568.1 ATP-binding cassette transporter [Chloropicon primus]|eukprot:QDZ21353.1 ATP-binding cassette transporter [Chloropicon primus]
MEEALDEPLLEERRRSGSASTQASREDDGAGVKRWTIRRVVLQESAWLALGCVVLLIRMPFSIAMPYFQALVLAKLAGHERHEVWSTIKFMAGAGCIDAVLDFWCVYLFSYTKSRLIKSLRLKLFEKVLAQEIGYFDVTPSGELSSRLTTDIATLANDMTWVFRFSIEAVARILGVSLTLFHTDWRLALVTCTAVPLLAGANRLYSKFLRENAIRVQDSLAKANSVAQEVLSCFRVVYSFANEKYEYQRYQKEVSKNFHLNVKQAIIDGFYYMFVSTFLMNTAVRVLIIGYGAHLFFAGEIDFEKLSRFVFFLDMLQNWCNMLFDSFSNLIKSGGASAKVFEILNRTGAAGRGKGGAGDDRRGDDEGEPLDQRNDAAGSGQGHVAFENVHFSYPARPGDIVLKGITFEAEAGKTLAIIGRSGSGKSTLIHLIENFYQPSAGRVLLDGRDVHSFEHTRLHSIVSIVNQDTVLFGGTIYDNITYSVHNSGEPLLARELMPRVVEAAKVANIHDFISSLPEGYDTEVGERGVQLSGGQRQRIAIARAVLMNPRVLLLDEATSSLDNESEKAVKDALDRVMENKTVIVVAHRLSTIMNAHSILVMEDGAIVDCGPPSGMQDRLRSGAADMEILE